METQIRVLPQPLSEFAVSIYGTEQLRWDLGDHLLKVASLIEATLDRPSRVDELAEAVGEVLITLDMLYQAPLWREVEKWIGRDTSRLASCMACHGFRDPEGHHE